MDHPVETPFVDFQNVWLAYNEELWAEGRFAVEDINLQVGRGELACLGAADQVGARGGDFT